MTREYRQADDAEYQGADEEYRRAGDGEYQGADEEYRRAAEDPGGIDLDADVRAMAARHRRVGGLLTAAYALAALGAAAAGFLADGPVLALLAVAAVYVLGGLPLVRIRAESELVTDRPPSAVREALRRPVNPFTALPVAWADEVEPVEVPGTLGAVTVRRNGLGIGTDEFRIAVTEGEGRPGDREYGDGGHGTGGREDDGSEGGNRGSDRSEGGGRGDNGNEGGSRGNAGSGDDGRGGDEPIRLWFSTDGAAFSVMEVRIRGDGDRTRVSVDGRPRSRVGGVRLVAYLIEGRYQERVVEHYGYEHLDSTLSVGLRGTGASESR